MRFLSYIRGPISSSINTKWSHYYPIYGLSFPCHFKDILISCHGHHTLSETPNFKIGNQKKRRRTQQPEPNCSPARMSDASTVPGGSESGRPNSNGFRVSHNSFSTSSSPFTDYPHSNPPDARYMEISVMTLNVLAQRYIEKHRSLYRTCDPICTQWEYRKKLLIQTFRDYTADVVCLQEVESQHYSDTIEPHFKSLGYKGWLAVKSEDLTEGCAMFYNPQRLRLKSVHQLHFYRPDLCRQLNRNNVAIIGTFEGALPHEEGNTRFYVATTHLLFNPKRGDIKLAQLRLLLAQLESMSRRDNTETISHHPVIFCGDLNLEPDSPLSYFIQAGTLNAFDCKSGDLSGQKESRGSGQHIMASDMAFANLDRMGYLTGPHGSRSRADTPTSDNSRDRSTENTSRPTTCSVPSSDVYQDPYIIRQPLPLRSVYKSFSRYGGNLVTTFHSEASAMVDYILFHSASDKLQLIKRKNILTDQQMTMQGCLPNHEHGSDHIPLWAKFRLVHSTNPLVTSTSTSHAETATSEQ